MVGRDRVALVDDGRETSAGRVAAGRRGELGEGRLTVLHQDLAGGGVGGRVGPAVLARDTAVDLRILGVVDLLATRDRRKCVGAGRHGLRLQRRRAAGVAPGGQALARDDALDVVVDVDAVHHAPAFEAHGPAVGLVRSAELEEFTGRAVGRHAEGFDEGGRHRPHHTAAAPAADGGRAPGQADRLPGSHRLTTDSHAGVRVHIHRALTREGHQDLGPVHLPRGGATVVVAQDLLCRPALAGVAVRSPLPHSAAVAMTVPDQRHRRPDRELDLIGRFR